MGVKDPTDQQSSLLTQAVLSSPLTLPGLTTATGENGLVG
jgi:hypothetical protein